MERVSDKSPPSVLLEWLAAGQLLESRLEQALEPIGLSLSKLNVLSHLANANESLALGDLASRLQCVRSNVTQVMDRLEAEGLVRRLYDATDRRTIRAELTQLGRDKHSAGSKALSQVDADIAGALTAADLAAIQRVASSLK